MARKYFIAFIVTRNDGFEETMNSFAVPARPITDIEDIRKMELALLQQFSSLNRSEVQKPMKVTIISLTSVT